jgi:hypothetical protein
MSINQKRLSNVVTENEIDDNWLVNDTSFDAFIRNTLGSNDDPRGSGGIRLDSEGERPSFGSGIHRGSTDLMMLRGIAGQINNHRLSKAS